MSNSEKLKELFSDKANTQLMRQEIDLYGLKYIKAGDLMLLHSYYEKKDGKSLNPLFSAPALVAGIDNNSGITALTIKTLKDGLDAYGVSLVKSMQADEIEVYYTHLAEEILRPKISKSDWDNWVFSFSVPDSEKLELRKKHTRNAAAKLYRGLQSLQFENKRVLFIGSGDGDETDTLITYFALRNSEIWAIDQSRAAGQSFNQLISKHPGITFNFQLLDMEDLPSLSQKQFDIIIALGFFDRETLNEEQGKKFLKLTNENLSFSHFATSAYNFELFSKSDYERAGFRVLASSVPQSIYTKDYSFFYLLEKAG